ncbi:MAG: glycosyltransferase family 1 protein [Sphaerobacter sp.]|nr:glycosyltransferase family 1 protein [Sphaerobacter sp.]
MRVAIDYTPAIAQRGGVGRYTRSLVHALAARLGGADELVLWHASDADPAGANDWATPRVRFRRLPVPERLATIAWQRLRIPARLEWMIGPVEVVHGPDFVVPPTRAPAVVTIHDLSYLVTPEHAHPNLRRYLLRAVPRALDRAAAVIAVSQTTAADLTRHYGIAAERITVIPNGVDPLFRPPSPELVQQVLARLEVRAPYFIIVGTVEPRKNHQTVLRAFEEVHRAHPDVSLVIVGRPGWLAEPIVAAIKAAARRLPIRWLSQVDDSLLPALYSGSLALVYPSWYEGFGLPIVEAMASGAPVVTSDHGALAEVAGDAALLAPAGDAGALAALMCRLIEEPDLRADRVRRGQRHAAHFTWDAAAEAHLAVYRWVSAGS